MWVILICGNFKPLACYDSLGLYLNPFWHTVSYVRRFCRKLEEWENLNPTLKRLLTPFVRTVDSRDAARKSNLCTTPLALKSSMDLFTLGYDNSMAQPRLMAIPI